MKKAIKYCFAVGRSAPVGITTVPTWGNFYHTTADGSGGLTYAGVDWSRSMASYAKPANFMNATVTIADVTDSISFAFTPDKSELAGQEALGFLCAAGAYIVQESGTTKAAGSISAGVVLKLAISGTTVTYYVGGSLVYTSAVSAGVNTTYIKVGASAGFISAPVLMYSAAGVTVSS